MHALALPCFFVCFIVLNQAYGLARPKRAGATKLLELTQNCRILNEDFLKLVLKNRANKSVQILNDSVDFSFFGYFSFFLTTQSKKKEKYKTKTKIILIFSHTISLDVRALKHHFFGGKETVHKETTRPDNFSLNLLTTRQIYF